MISLYSTVFEYFAKSNHSFLFYSASDIKKSQAFLLSHNRD
nr:MAG TPA: hypothetical protein [Caudoviricetes sp.]